MGSLATRRVSGWRTALKLGRVSNLPTVWSNVIVGCALGGGARLHWLIAVGIAISAMYVAGMFLNDVFDRNIDARERPERPIPSGEISTDVVVVIGVSLLVVGIVGLAAVNDRAGLVGLALVASIVLYDWQHKGNPIAPFVMGLCRALVYIAAAAAASVSVPSTVLVPAAALLLYIAGVTYTARMESLDRIASVWPLMLLAAPPRLRHPRQRLLSRRHHRTARTCGMCSARRAAAAASWRRRCLSCRRSFARCDLSQRRAHRDNDGSELCTHRLPRLLRRHARSPAQHPRKLMVVAP